MKRQPGNPLLVPEQAETVSGGVVLTPHWIENLTMSFDWYSITLHNGIFAPSANQIFTECSSLHLAQFCSLVFFAQGYPGNSNSAVAAEVDGNGLVNSPLLHGVTYSADREGAFNFYLQAPVNGNRETTSGLDFQMDYSHELFDGTMAWHLLGNYTDEKTRTSLGQTVDGAGAVSNDGTLNPLTGFDEPKLHLVVSSTYQEGPWAFTAQARIIGSAVLTNNLTQLQSTYTSIDDNNVPASDLWRLPRLLPLERPYSALWRGGQLLQRAAARPCEYRRWRHELRHLRLHRPQLPYRREVRRLERELARGSFHARGAARFFLAALVVSIVSPVKAQITACAAAPGKTATSVCLQDG